MATRTISLDQVRIAEPCPVSWNDMRGDDQRRFCAHCNRHVHNLSAMPQDEAQRLVCESAGRLCIAYHPNAQGGVTPLEYARPKAARYRWRVVAALAGLGGIASTFATVVYGPRATVPPAPLPAGRMIVPGMMAPVTPPPAPAPPACGQ